MDKQKLLTLYLRLGGAVMLLAAGAIFLPTTWMNLAHEKLGLGPFPDSPITQYLTRTISCLYAMRGGLFLVLAQDVVRYRPVIQFLAVGNLALSLFFFGIDYLAGLHIYWVLAEGPMIACIGAILFYLNRGSAAS